MKEKSYGWSLSLGVPLLSSSFSSASTLLAHAQSTIQAHKRIYIYIYIQSVHKQREVVISFFFRASLFNHSRAQQCWRDKPSFLPPSSLFMVVADFYLTPLAIRDSHQASFSKGQRQLRWHRIVRRLVSSPSSETLLANKLKKKKQIYSISTKAPKVILSTRMFLCSAWL